MDSQNAAGDAERRPSPVSISSEVAGAAETTTTKHARANENNSKPEKSVVGADSCSVPAPKPRSPPVSRDSGTQPSSVSNTIEPRDLKKGKGKKEKLVRSIQNAETRNRRRE